MSLGIDFLRRDGTHVTDGRTENKANSIESCSILLLCIWYMHSTGSRISLSHYENAHVFVLRFRFRCLLLLWKSSCILASCICFPHHGSWFATAAEAATLLAVRKWFALFRAYPCGRGKKKYVMRMRVCIRGRNFCVLPLSLSIQCVVCAERIFFINKKQITRATATNRW